MDSECANQAGAIPCVAPNMIDVEGCYLAQHVAADYAVVVGRPEAEPGLTQYAELAERCGIDDADCAASAFLAFPCRDEDETRDLMARLPAGMAMLYVRGECRDVNC